MYVQQSIPTVDRSAYLSMLSREKIKQSNEYKNAVDNRDCCASSSR